MNDLESILVALLVQALNVWVFQGKTVSALSTKCTSFDVDSRVTNRATAVLDTLSTAMCV